MNTNDTATSTTVLPAATIIPCDDRCMFAKLDECDCACGGVNHQQGSKLTAVQREIPRTRVGRRIPLVTPNSAAWDSAWAMYELREDEGYTNREIASEFGVGAATVRRAIKSLLTTLAIADTQAAHAA